MVNGQRVGYQARSAVVLEEFVVESGLIEQHASTVHKVVQVPHIARASLDPQQLDISARKCRPNQAQVERCKGRIGECANVALPRPALFMQKAE